MFQSISFAARMVDLRIVVSICIVSFLFACQGKSPHDMTIDELDGHIHDLQFLLDSLETVKQYKVEQDTTGRYALVAEEISEIDDIFENKSVVFIKGKIDTSHSISKLRITQDRPYQRDFIQSISVDRDGAFTDEFEIDKNGLFTLKIDSYTQDIYLENGKTVGVIIDSTSSGGIRFIGDLSEENNFLTSKQSDFENQYNALFDISAKDLQSTKDLIETTKDSINADYANHWSGQSRELSSAFKELIKNRIQLNESRVLLAKAQKSESPFDDIIFQPQNILLDSDELFNLFEFRKYVFEYFEYKTDSLSSNLELLSADQVDYWRQKYNAVESLFTNQSITDFLKTDVIFESIAKIRSSSLNPLIRDFKSDVSNGAYLSTINNRYNSILKPRRGTLAPDVIGETVDGDDFNLTQLKGKYVYIFVWATWCGPCKIEIPYYERMIEDYSEENIEFVGISVDRSKKKWIESFFYNPYPGLQVLVPGDWKSPLVTDYEISTIPQFILINPNGEIAELNAERPTKNIKAQLSQYGIIAKTY